MIFGRRIQNRKILLTILLVIALCGIALLLAPQPQKINPAWETFSDPSVGVSFQYPKELSTHYIHAFDWPPKISIFKETYSCTEAGQATARAGRTEERTIRGNTYCVTELVEGAAGSTYTQYAYAFEKKDRVLILTFSLRAPQCGNYDDPKKTECENERKTFSIDSLVNEITQTVNLDILI